MILFKPHPALEHLIYFYVYNEIDFSSIQSSNQYLFTPTHKKFIAIYLEDPITVSSQERTEEVKEFVIVGPQTRPVNLNLNRKHRMLAIKLKPCAQHYMLNGFPMHRLADSYLKGGDVFNNHGTELMEKLKQVQKPLMLKVYLDEFFLKIAKTASKQSKIDLMLEEMEIFQSVDELSRSANISARQFERICNERLGMPPKLYLRIKRFSKAYALKELNPELKWTDVAHIFNYYDQMHLIRDFREFAGYTPSEIDTIVERSIKNYANFEVRSSSFY